MGLLIFLVVLPSRGYVGCGGNEGARWRSDIRTNCGGESPACLSGHCCSDSPEHCARLYVCFRGCLGGAVDACQWPGWVIEGFSETKSGDGDVRKRPLGPSFVGRVGFAPLAPWGYVSLGRHTQCTSDTSYQIESDQMMISHQLSSLSCA